MTTTTKADITADIGHAVVEATLALRESHLVNVIDERVLFLTSSVSGSSHDVTGSLANATSPVSKELRAAMKAHGAAAALLVLPEVADGFCGRSFIQLPGKVFLPFGYVLARCLGEMSLAHEMTHLLGANHSYPDEPAFATDTYGYHDVGADYRTLEGACPQGVHCRDRIPALSDRSKHRGSATANSARLFPMTLCALTPFKG
jgi:hypothetical protein